MHPLSVRCSSAGKLLVHSRQFLKWHLMFFCDSCSRSSASAQRQCLVVEGREKGSATLAQRWSIVERVQSNQQEDSRCILRGLATDALPIASLLLHISFGDETAERRWQTLGVLQRRPFVKWQEMQASRLHHTQPAMQTDASNGSPEVAAERDACSSSRMGVDAGVAPCWLIGWGALS